MDKKTALSKILKYIENEKPILNDNIIDNIGKIHIEEILDHICYLRELTWKEGLKIDAQSFKTNGKNLYFSSENEKREIIKLALLKIEDKDNNEVNFTFENLSHIFIEQLWISYQKYLHLTANEIDFIYQSAQKYFNPNNEEAFPLHPMIIEVDYMTKGLVNYSKSEFNMLTIKEFEAIQLILAAKNKA